MKWHSQGFSLIEVLIALAMVTITLSSLISLQGMLQKMLYTDTRQWQAEQVAIKIFEMQEKKEPLKPDETFEFKEEGFKGVYTLQKPSDKSALKEIKDMFLEKVVISWTELFGPQEQTWIKLRYRPEKQEKKNEQEVQKQPVGKPGPAAQQPRLALPGGIRS